MEDKTDRFFKVLAMYKSRIFGTILGLIIGILVIGFGWIKALSFLFCVLVGYFFGKRADGEGDFWEKAKDNFIRFKRRKLK